MLYALTRAALFQLDPELAHDLALKSLSALGPGAALLGAGTDRGEGLRVMGIDFPNPVGLAAGLDKNGEYIDALAAPRLRLHRDRHRHAAPAAGQSEAAHVPPARARGAHQPPGLQQRGRGEAPRERRARELPRRARHQHRQELRHADRARRRRLPRVPRRRVRARHLRHGEHLVAQHEEPARAAVEREAGRAAGPRHGTPRIARRPPWNGEAHPREGRAGPGRCAGRDDRRARGEARRGRAHRDQHDREPRGDRGTPACGRVGGLERPPALRALDGNSPQALGVARRPRSADRRRRNPLGGRRTRQDRRGASLVQVYTGFIYRGPALIGEARRALRA